MQTNHVQGSNAGRAFWTCSKESKRARYVCDLFYSSDVIFFNGMMIPAPRSLLHPVTVEFISPRRDVKQLEDDALRRSEVVLLATVVLASRHMNVFDVANQDTGQMHGS